MRKKLPRVVTDIDDTKAIFWSEFVRWHNDAYGTQYTPQELSTTRPQNITEDEFGTRFYAFFETDAFANLPVVPGSKESIDRLASDGFAFSAVTFRSLITQRTTENWLEREFPGIYQDVFCIHGESFNKYADPSCTRKSQACRRFGASIIVDDDPKVVLECAENGILAFFLRGDWNSRSLARLCLPKYVIPVSSWGEIEDSLRKQY